MKFMLSFLTSSRPNFIQIGFNELVGRDEVLLLTLYPFSSNNNSFQLFFTFLFISNLIVQ